MRQILVCCLLFGCVESDPVGDPLRLDKGVVDAVVVVPDGATDGPVLVPDAGLRDAAPDRAVPDSAPDMAIPDVAMPDAGDVGNVGPSYVNDVQPLLEAHCGRCHGMNITLPNFATEYAATQQASNLCPGNTVAECVARALSLQDTEGAACRTFEEPFHRAGWVCMSDEQIDLVSRWVENGTPEN